MNNIKIFTNENFGQVRTIVEDNKVLFVGKDVAKILGYKEPHKAIARHVKEDDRKKRAITDSMNRQQEAWIINESGLYALVLSSKLPQAKKIKRWITNEVLPNTRKHGLYAMEELLGDPDILINALQKLKEERNKTKQLQSEIKVKDQQILELQPKKSYYDIILQCKDAIPVTIIAKDYGISETRFNIILHDLKVQFKQNNIWLLYQKHASMGYTSTKTHDYTDSKCINQAKIRTYWTQKGRIFLYNLLKEHGILPIIERE